MEKDHGLIYKIYRKKDIKKAESKINLFGISKKFDVEYYLNFKFYTSFIVFVIIFLFFDNGALYAPIVMVIWSYLV
ncbi:MAG: hypothetical protein RSA10_02095, partial [Bacilli bacterium]